MARLKLDQDLLGLSTVIERRTGAIVKDCFKVNDTLYVIVSTGDLGKALGKKGETIKRIQAELDKKIRLIEYRHDMVEFVKNIIYPLIVEEIVEEDGDVLIKESSKKTKSLLIGRDGNKLNLINRAVKRFFNVQEVKVI